MNYDATAIVAIALVCLATLGIGALGLRLSRHHQRLLRRQPHRLPALERVGDQRRVPLRRLVPRRRRAGLALGADMLWFPVGYTVGYLVLLVLVAAPLRRSGAYTLPDFAEARLESRAVAGCASRPRRRHRLALPAAAVPGRRPGPADRHRRTALGRRAGRRGGGGRQRRRRRHAVDHVRAGLPVLAQAHRPRRAGVRPVWLWTRSGQPAPHVPGSTRPGTSGPQPLTGFGGRDHPVYAHATRTCSRSASARWACRTCSCASTPTPTARAARRTTLVVLGLLGAFYLFPPMYGALGRVYLPDPARRRAAPTPSCCMLPGRCCPGLRRRAADGARWPAARSRRSSPRRPG